MTLSYLHFTGCHHLKYQKRQRRQRRFTLALVACMLLTLLNSLLAVKQTRRRYMQSSFLKFEQFDCVPLPTPRAPFSPPRSSGASVTKPRHPVPHLPGPLQCPPLHCLHLFVYGSRGFRSIQARPAGSLLWTLESGTDADAACRATRAPRVSLNTLLNWPRSVTERTKIINRLQIV